MLYRGKKGKISALILDGAWWESFTSSDSWYRERDKNKSKNDYNNKSFYFYKIAGLYFKNIIVVKDKRLQNSSRLKETEMTCQPKLIQES